ncbi:MFS transporter [Micromonospora sp. SH-82]|uniref:MFS transporter n=1 Tax=Micromonospora sp. SH-82 TaxID=3132938 RepID=UPI003EBB20C0
MSLPTTTVPTRDTRAARAAVAVLFLTNGAVFFNIVPRYPQIKDDLGLDNALFGTALVAYPAGALLAGLLAGAAVRRLGSARVASFGIVVTTVATLAVPVAPHWTALAAALFVVGSLDAVVDVAQNAHGLRVQRRYGRSIVNSLHGVWSVGAVLGGLMGSAAAGLRIPLVIHLAASAVLFSAVALLAHRFLLPGDDNAERRPDAGAPSDAAVPNRRWRSFSAVTVRMLAALGVLAACGAVVEDAGASWGAIYLNDELNAGAATAGLAVVSLQVAMTVGRLTGDRVVDRYGQRTVARAGGALVTAGMGTALAVQSVPATLIGFALAGLGVATLVPAAMHTADELPGLPPGTGLTIVSWLLRGGFLLSAPTVGIIADLTSLRVGLLTVVLAGGLVLVLARVLANRPATPTTRHT